AFAVGFRFRPRALTELEALAGTGDLARFTVLVGTVDEQLAFAGRTVLRRGGVVTGPLTDFTIKVTVAVTRVAQVGLVFDFPSGERLLACEAVADRLHVGPCKLVCRAEFVALD